MMRPLVLLLALTLPQSVVADEPVRIGTSQFRPVAGWHLRVYFAPDGKVLIAPAESDIVQFWDVESGQLRHALTIAKSRFYDSDFAPKGQVLALFGYRWADDAAALDELTVWLVDTATRKVIHTLKLPDANHSVWFRVRLTPDGKRVITALDNELRVWDVKSGDELLRQKTQAGASVFAVSRDGKTVAFGNHDVYMWNWATGEEPKKLARILPYGARQIGFGATTTTLYIQPSSPGPIQTWDTATGKQSGTLIEMPAGFTLSPDGKTLAAGQVSKTSENSVALLDAATGKEQGHIPVGRSVAGSLSWSPDGTRLAATNSYCLRVWDVRTRKPLSPIEPGHEGTIGALAFAPDGRLFTASDDHTVRSWDATGKPGLELVHDSLVRGVAVSPDSTLVAGSALQNDLRIWDAKTGREVAKLQGNGSLGGKRRVRFTPDGKRLVAWGDDWTTRVWDLGTGKVVSEHRMLPLGVTEDDLKDPIRREDATMIPMTADISTDGTLFAIGTYKGVQLFDVATGKELMKFEGDTGHVAVLAFAPDGKRLVIAAHAKRIETRLPNGMTRSSGEKTHTIGVWDWAKSKPIWQATADGSWPSEVQFTPDGTRVAETTHSEGPTHALRLWDAATGRDLGRIDVPDSGGRFAFDATGKRVAVTRRNTTAIVYEVDAALKPNRAK